MVAADHLYCIIMLEHFMIRVPLPCSVGFRV